MAEWLVPVLVGMLAANACLAEAPPRKSWTEVKCDRYRQAWSEALRRRGTGGLGQDFLSAHQAFIASGCSLDDKVCPRSPDEIELANIMIVAAMNAGTASTFPPFGCRR